MESGLRRPGRARRGASRVASPPLITRHGSRSHPAKWLPAAPSALSVSELDGHVVSTKRAYSDLSDEVWQMGGAGTAPPGSTNRPGNAQAKVRRRFRWRLTAFQFFAIV